MTQKKQFKLKFKYFNLNVAGRLDKRNNKIKSVPNLSILVSYPNVVVIIPKVKNTIITTNTIESKLTICFLSYQKY